MNKILTFLMVILGLQLSAQKYETIVEDTDYKIEKTEMVCKSGQGYEYVYEMTKFSNLTSDEITLDFDYTYYYSDVCQNCENTDHGTHRTLVLPANSVIEGSCERTPLDYLRTLSYSKTEHPNAFKEQLTKLVIEKVQKQ